MTTGIDQAFNYNDLSGLNALKVQSRKDEDAALKNVAKQFESMFVNMMLKSMRQSNAVLAKDSLFNSKETDFYQGMHDEQMSLQMSQQGGMGIADMMYQQLKREGAPADIENIQLQPLTEPAQTFSLTTQNTLQALDPLVMLQKSTTSTPVASPLLSTKDIGQLQGSNLLADEPRLAKSLASTQENSLMNDTITSPIEFVKRLLPYAQNAAEKLGIDSKLLLAQAALETGWGKKIFNSQGDQSSFNLFGIKAGSRWQGEQAAVHTHEYEQGQRKNIVDQFRVYDNFQQSFDDYVGFIKNNQRYQAALTAGADYMHEIHQAGYATDPNYASKVKAIAASPMMAGLVNQSEQR